MPSPFYKLYSIVAWLTMSVTSVIITPVFLVVWAATFWWDRRRVAAHFMGTFWAWHYQSLIPFWKISLDGRKKIPWKRPVVMVSNHRSLIDILALYKIRRPFKWTSKSENFRLPFIGMVLSLTNSVRISRESLRSGAQFLAQAEKEMKKGSSILLFPEGTRSKTMQMRPFKEGAFLLARKTGSGIIPIVHTGSEKTFDKGSWVLKGKAHIHIRVLDEIPAETVQQFEVRDLMAMVREKMERELAELEMELAGEIGYPAGKGPENISP
ncbi:MAG: 1-acyl-sn-glycerol-3-phosphate acyltransferase [Bacteroidales bacterium]|nr:1-acyl-sn-glycerol-3-phosphate acyltransferase [Bacteroidales bacterium]